MDNFLLPKIDEEELNEVGKLTKANAKINNASSKAVLKTSVKARAIRDYIEKLETRLQIAKENGNLPQHNSLKRQILFQKAKLKVVLAGNLVAQSTQILSKNSSIEKDKKLLKKSSSEDDD